MRFSVLIPYLNRERFLSLALRFISESSVRDLEIIIVDDGSDPGREAERCDLVCKYPLRLYLIRKEKKRTENCCAVLNWAASVARGDVIMFQEPSVIQTGDVFQHVEETFTPGRWRSYACYSADAGSTERVIAACEVAKAGTLYPTLVSALGQTNDTTAWCDFCGAWYNHSRYRPVGYPWTIATDLSEFKQFGGYDMRFAGGRASEDVNLLNRYRRRGFPIEVVDQPWVVHLAHETSPSSRSNAEVFVTADKEDGWVANGEVLVPPDLEFEPELVMKTGGR